jgi:hypothetical protein
MSDANSLPMWVIYDHPRDHPDCYFARLWMAGKTIEATSQCVGANDIEILRKMFRDMGLTCLSRIDQDDPKIVEAWL